MAAILKVWRQIEKRKSRLVNREVKNIPAKFHPDPIWNDGALCFFKDGDYNKKKKKKKMMMMMSSDMRSVPDQKICVE